MTILKEWLDNNEKRYASVAKKLGVSSQYFHSILSGMRYPSVPMAKKIAKYTNDEIKWHDLINQGDKDENN